MAIIRAFADEMPQVAGAAFVAENAVILGRVTIAEGASIWYGAVLRGDIGWIRIGQRSNIQDNCVVHMSDHNNTELGQEVTVGHAAVIHGARVQDGALIGMGAILLDDCEIGEEAIVAAGSLVPPRMRVPARTLVRGNPARVIRELEANEQRMGREGAAHYVMMSARYQSLRVG
jgi:gamma-carbonic anhydrase